MSTSATIEAGDVLDRSSVVGLVQRLDRALREGPQRLTLDLSDVQRFDSAGLGGVVEGMRRAAALGVDVRLRGLSQPMLDFFSLVSTQRLLGTGKAGARRVSFVTRIGEVVDPMLQSGGAIVRDGLAAVRGLLIDPLRGRGLRLDRTVIELDHCAVGALPIVALIAFLLGLILAMQAYVQLRVWGAEIYMADMVAVSAVSEIGPLMTAIVLAARSGSSNAAQLGAMVVGEEIDALRQMGISPARFLVLPKVVACAASAVLLSVIFDVVAICGGALFAWAVAGIDPGAYEEQTRTALAIGDLFVALAKGLVFGGGIGVVGCTLGLRVEGGSVGVGKATTNSVVLGVFLIIVTDAVFVFVQRMLL
ncbi:MAG: ABC transporter permease [Planctomycetota bacterium]